MVAMAVKKGQWIVTITEKYSPHVAFSGTPCFLLFYKGTPHAAVSTRYSGPLALQNPLNFGISSYPPSRIVIPLHSGIEPAPLATFPHPLCSDSHESNNRFTLKTIVSVAALV